MASGDLNNREQMGPLLGTFLGPSLDIKSERALMPSAAIVKVMSVWDSQVYLGSDSR